MSAKHPNAAIDHDLRPLVGQAIRVACDQSGFADDPTLKVRLLLLANRLSMPGPPLVSTADLHEMLDALHKTEYVSDGERVEFFGGTVRSHGEGWLMDYDGKSEGVYKSTLAAAALELYERHLQARGVAPHA